MLPPAMSRQLILLSLPFLLHLPTSVWSISAYWTPVLPQVCGPSVPTNLTRALFACDRLMDKQLAGIFENCVYTVHKIPRKAKLDKPKLCYYRKQGLQLDRCKMMKYRAQGFTLQELVEKEQDHTWCLMKIAQPLGWERLCSDNPRDAALIEARQDAIQECEQQYNEITGPIRECFNETLGHSSGGGGGGSGGNPVASLLNWARSKQRNGGGGGGGGTSDLKTKPAACISFQFSKKIWRCLTTKDPNQSLQRRANQYLGCLRNVRRSSGDGQVAAATSGLASSASSPPPNRRNGVGGLFGSLKTKNKHSK